MMRFQFRTAGESHGRGLVSLVEGVPAGLSLVAERDVDPELRRRQGGYGRGGRMKIEKDAAEFMAGVRLGDTLGGPIAMLIWNRDWANWQVGMSPEPQPDADEKTLRRVHLPRPGHADLVGVLKYDRADARDVLERASARETTARVAAGAVAKRLLAEFGVTIGSHVVMLGGVEAALPDHLPDDLNEAVDESPLRTLDRDAETRMIEAIDDARSRGDTLGGCFEVVARGLPVGLGSHVAWDRKLDGRIAYALMSIQAMKGVEIGMGFDAARRPGSQVHDEIESDPDLRRTGGYRRLRNNAGGLEGGITNGEDVIVRGALKPISTLPRPLPSADLITAEHENAFYERSDVCVVPAAGVIGEAMVALVLADAVLEKFGGDNVAETLRNYRAYMKTIGPRGEW
jgi:chorismate synthase